MESSYILTNAMEKQLRLAMNSTTPNKRASPPSKAQHAENSFSSPSSPTKLSIGPSAHYSSAPEGGPAELRTYHGNTSHHDVAVPQASPYSFDGNFYGHSDVMEDEFDSELSFIVNQVHVGNQRNENMPYIN